MLLNCGPGEDSWESLRQQWNQTSNPTGNQPWVYIGRTDAEAEAPILWPPNLKNGLIRKDPNSGKDLRQEEKGITEDEMVGWHHQLNGHELEQTPGVGDGQGGLAYCSPWGRKELDTIGQLNWTECSSYILPTSLWEDPYIVVEIVHILELARARFESHLFYIITMWLWKYY